MVDSWYLIFFRMVLDEKYTQILGWITTNNHL
jgi:hypothetical protein